MKKELSLVILINLLIIGLNANAKINQNELVKSLFLQEVHILSAIEDEVNIENFYNYFDFRMTVIGHDSGNINIYEVDSFSYKQERLTAIHDTCKYFVAIYNNQEGSVNRTVSSYFFTLLPSAGNHAWFPAEFFCLQSYMISYLSPKLMANCCEMRAQFARGIVHFSEMLR